MSEPIKVDVTVTVAPKKQYGQIHTVMACGLRRVQYFEVAPGDQFDKAVMPFFLNEEQKFTVSVGSPEPKQQTKGKNDKETNDSGSSSDGHCSLGASR